MHLAEILGLRPVAGAGVIMMVTRRCPLGCAHCSTSSTRRGADASAGMLTRFAASFGVRPPRVVLLTGGEPLLRPAVVRTVAEACHQAGAAVMMLSGMYFARGFAALGPGAPVRAALAVADHVSASLDVYHEREVARRDVFGVLHWLRERGTSVSVHMTGTGPADRYLADATAAVRAEFGDEVPMLVSRVRPVGRAAGRLSSGDPGDHGPWGPLPCAMAAWPVVGADGRITACCNADVVDGRVRPGHLELGHALTDGWAEVRARLDSPALRALRITGPWAAGPGYCLACQRLGAPPAPGYSAALADQVTELQCRAGAAGFARRYGIDRYADLVRLGA